LKPQYDEPLSKFASNFNLRRYTLYNYIDKRVEYLALLAGRARQIMLAAALGRPDYARHVVGLGFKV
jgi:hypothetical protein